MLSLIVGCGEKAGDLVKEFRPKVEAQFARIKAAAASDAAKPNAAPPELTEKLVFSRSGGNAYVVLSEDLLDPPKEAQHNVIGSYSLFESVRETIKEPGERDGKGVRADFEEFTNIRYLVVVSTWSYTPARATSDNTFEGGSWDGAMTILDLDKGGSVGMLTARSGSSDVVTSTQKNAASEMRSDLYGHAARAINAALEPYMAAGQKAL